MHVRTLQYFTTLAREGHFARAAESCAIAQPTLSVALAALEEEVGKRLIDRDRRYIGLTPEGEAMLPWAQQIVAAHDALLQSVNALSKPLHGELRLGAIPAALPATGAVCSALLKTNPQLSVSVQSLTSSEIRHGLTAFTLDAGITYVDDSTGQGFMHETLATETHILVAPAAGRHPEKPDIGWAEAAGYPLCLLHGGMQHRRIIDAAFAHHGVTVTPHVTADSFVALLAMVRTGNFATIVPGSHRFLLDGLDWARLTPLQQHPGEDVIGLIVLDRAPMSAFSLAALSAARRSTTGAS